MPDRILIADIERRIAEHLQKRQQAPKPPEPPKYWTEPLTGMEFVRIPAGRFWMGQTEADKRSIIEDADEDTYNEYYTDELPRHEVTLNDFWLAKTPVTNRQYRLWKPDHGSKDYEGHSLNGDEQPAVYVSWEDAHEFLHWLNEQQGDGTRFRLPSEAEWEYACRAGTTTMRFWGDNPDEAARWANVADKTAQKEWPIWTVHNCETGYVVSSPVGSFQPNNFDVYDMLGNVWEWCEDPWHDNYDGAPSNGSVWDKRGGLNRVLRGGSWLGLPRGVRCAYRDHSSPQGRDDLIGFRLARTI